MTVPHKVRSTLSRIIAVPVKPVLNESDFLFLRYGGRFTREFLTAEDFRVRADPAQLRSGHAPFSIQLPGFSGYSSFASAPGITFSGA